MARPGEIWRFQRLSDGFQASARIIRIEENPKTGKLGVYAESLQHPWRKPGVCSWINLPPNAKDQAFATASPSDYVWTREFTVFECPECGVVVELQDDYLCAECRKARQSEPL